MPALLTAYIKTWRGVYSYLYSDLHNCANYLRSLGDQIFDENWGGAREACYMAENYLRSASTHFWGGTPSLYTAMYTAMHWIDVNWSAGGAVNMDDMLNAMLTASFNQLQKFIGIEDAYRVALWNAPFNADFYAALARGFQKWP